MMGMDSKMARDLNLESILEAYQPYTSMGKQEQLFVYTPGEEEKWQQVMDEQEWLMHLMDKHPPLFPRLQKQLKEIPSPYALLDKLEWGENLAFTEWFVLKNFLWSLFTWMKELEEVGLHHSLCLDIAEKKNCEELLWKLNPKAPLRPSFSIDSAYDENLKAKRTRLREIEKKRDEEKERRAINIEKSYGLKRNAFGEWVVEKGSELDGLLKKEACLSVLRETTYDLYYQLQIKEEATEIEEQIYLHAQIKRLEEDVMEQLSTHFRPLVSTLKGWAHTITHFDLVWARVRAAQSWQGVKPTLSAHLFCFTGAFHPYVRQTLEEKGKSSTPIDFEMKQGVAVITGPNMGGKTVALKTIGVIAALAQLGFFVPAVRCTVPLFPWIGTVLNDHQDIQSGLSSYGAEISELMAWLDRSQSGLLLMDELGRSTNPLEGSALVQAVTTYLTRDRKWTVLVTHYSEGTTVEGIQPYRIAGVDSAQLERTGKEEIRANISQFMDYRLVPMERGESHPHQALLIAEVLGLDQQIIQEAKRLVAAREEIRNG